MAKQSESFISLYKCRLSHLWLFFVCLVPILIACSREQTDLVEQWLKPNGRVKVLSTTAMIDDLVKKIGGDRVDTLVLIRGELDPHSYQLVKGDDEKFVYADLVFFSGLGLEHGPSLQKYLQTDKKAISLGGSVKQANPHLILEYDKQPDPHIWMDISLWAETIPAIVKALASKDPAHTDLFRMNAAKVKNDLLSAHDRIRYTLQKIPPEHRYLVTSHDAFNYFTRAYLATEQELRDHTWQERFAAPEGLAPDSQLSPSHIREIIDHVSKYNVHVLFPESNVSRDSIRKILQAGSDKGLNLRIANEALYGDAMGPAGSDGDGYVPMIEHNARVIAKELSNER